MLDINPPERHARAMSIWGMGIMVGPILGPILGGWLTESVSWRWVFYVNLPVGLATLALMWALLPATGRRDRKFDLFGFRSEERRVGKECVSTCSSRWSPYP